MSPYPSPYNNISDQRPSSSPHSLNDHQGLGACGMIQLPLVELYGFKPSHAEFAYFAVPGDRIDGSSSWNGQNHGRVQRPSTGASSISATSHTSLSQANTPPVGEAYSDSEIDINLCKPPSHFSPTQLLFFSSFIARGGSFTQPMSSSPSPDIDPSFYLQYVGSQTSLTSLELVSPDFRFVAMNEHLSSAYAKLPDAEA